MATSEKMSYFFDLTVPEKSLLLSGFILIVAFYAVHTASSTLGVTFGGTSDALLYTF